MAVRYAIYYAPPPDHPLWAFGCRILGYDAARGADVTLNPPAGFDAATWFHSTREPRRYGFHATLKAPFELASSATEEDLRQSMRALARRLDPVRLGGLRVSTIGRFVALVPVGPTDHLGETAFRIVQDLEPVRGPLSPFDRERRLAGAGLTPRQIELLDRYGYPYVAEEFRFHMTLSGPLDAPVRETARASIADRFEADIPDGPHTIDRIALFAQPAREEPFRIVETITFG